MLDGILGYLKIITKEQGTKLFPKHPRTYGKELPKITNIEEPKLNDIGKKISWILNTYTTIKSFQKIIFKSTLSCFSLN